MVTSEMFLAVCWDLRLLVVAFLCYGQRRRSLVSGATLLQGENASGADNQQGSLRDPSTTARQASHSGMVIQSELSSDRKLIFQRLVGTDTS